MMTRSRVRLRASAASLAIAVAVIASGSCRHRTTELLPSARPSIDSLLPLDIRRVEGPAAGGAVLDAGPPNSWRASWVGMPTADFDGTIYRMWFTGTATAAPGESPYLYRSGIGLATSRDGITWTVENDGQPVLAPGAPGAFDAHSVSHPFVMRRAGRFMMWYAGGDGTQGPNSVRVERLGLATSADGIHWSRENGGRAVIDIGAEGSSDTIQVASPCVVDVGGRLYIWYGAYNGRHTIVLATSTDGIEWRKEQDGRPVEGLSLGASFGELGPSVYHDGNGFLMLYNSDREGEWRMYAALSRDGQTWTRPSDEPVLGPASPPAFDSAGTGRNRSVHATQLIFSGERILAWYTGEDSADRQRIGLMELIRPAGKHRAEFDDAPDRAGALTAAAQAGRD